MHTSSPGYQLLAVIVAILLMATSVLAGSGRGATARQDGGWKISGRRSFGRSSHFFMVLKGFSLF